MRKKVEKFFLWKWLLSIERFVMIFSSIVVVLTIAAGVVCRYFLKINFAGSDEILVIFALWLYFVGGIYGSYEDCHIKADVLSILLSKETARYVMNILVKAISLAVSIWLAVWACQYLNYCLKTGGYTIVYHLPMLCSRGALVVGYVLPVLYNVYHLILSVVERQPSSKGLDAGPSGDSVGGGDPR